MTKTVAQFVDTTIFGGAEAIAVDLAKAFGARGYKTHLYHFPSPDLERRAAVAGVELRVLDDWPLYKSWKSLPVFASRFSSRLKREGVSILHSHLFGSAIGGGLATRLAGLPHAATLHDVYTLEEQPFFRVRALQATAMVGTRFVTVARFLEAYCRERAWFPSDRLRTIYNGISLPQPGPAARARIRRELGIPEQDIVFITVGRLVELKRQHLLIEAFAKLPDSMRARLLIVGDGTERRTLEALTDSLGARGRVLFAGFQTDVPAYLAASDCFVLVSSTECLSCSILEAMAQGLPVVATEVGGNPELIDDGVTGRFCEPDAAKLNLLFAQLAAAPAALQRMGAAGCEKVKMKFTAARMISEYEALYEKLVR